MKFEAMIGCRDCQDFETHTIRSKLDAGIFIQLAIVCQKCGNHDVNWYDKRDYQELFLNKLQRRKNDKMDKC